MSRAWLLIICASTGLALLRQISVVFFTPWQNDYGHWFAVCLIAVVGVVLPLALGYRRWRDGPDANRQYRQAFVAAWSNNTRATKYVVVWIAIALVLVVIFNLRPPQ
jgi:hypothetical protein